jgi:DNA primase
MAGFIPPDKLEQIRSASDIVDIIGAVLPLKRAGANFTALCPFHREKSPSFNVNPHKQIFHCFGCHKGGDVFTFVREYENLSFPEAIKRLADRANIPLEFENQPGQQQARHLKDTLLQMHEGIAQRWQTALANDAGGQVARDYLAKRGVSDEAIKLFRLGYAPEAWDDTVNWARSKDYELPIVEQGGLIIRKENTDRYYDRFRGRLMFPICDEQGRIIGFSGRVLAGDEKTAKYVNSPETPIFTKGKVLYALDKAKRPILDLGFAVVCEGQLDTIACHSGGITNAIAPQGTALTAAHARTLRRYTDDIILCFDGDAAGKRAAARVLDDLILAGIPFRVASIPPPDDPDSYIKKFGRDSLMRLLAGAEEFFDFYLKLQSSQHNPRSDRGRQEIVRSMAEVLQKASSSVVVDTYAQKTAQMLEVDVAAVRAEFKKGARPKPESVEPDERLPESEPTLPPPNEREFWLLRFLLINDDHLDWVAQNLDLNWIQHPIVRRVVSVRLDSYADQSWRGVPALLDELEDAAAASLVTEAVTHGQSTAELSRNLTEAVRMLRSDYIDRQLATLKLRLAQPGLPEVETVSILTQQSELRKLRQQPLG